MKMHRLLKSYFISHMRNCITCFGTICREPWNSAVTIIVIGIALALPTGLMVLLNNVQKINTHWNNGIQLSVFLRSSATESILKDKQPLLQQAAITKVQYISPEKALKEFEQATEQADLLHYLDNNPLPPTLIINLKTQTSEQEIEAIMQQMQQWPEVEHLQLDRSWLQRLNALLKLADYLVTIITIILALAVFLITGNTIRLNIEKRKRHIIITKLIGATNSFIRREFLYLGFWYGLLGGIIAWLIVTISIAILKKPVAELAFLYQSNFVLLGIDGNNTCMLIVLGITLGISGAWVSVGKYLDTLALE